LRVRHCPRIGRSGLSCHDVAGSTAFASRELNAGRTGNKIKDVRYHRSHTDSIIQAADMLSGAIYTRYHRDNEEFLAYIRVKISDLWEWRPNTQ
ncbi:MAG: DUF3800 domain-containing protein, partial [Thermomicrobiales bacterium]|nr:DUF3800 domain-containing protein [Thermomicrobiales bacterium]